MTVTNTTKKVTRVGTGATFTFSFSPMVIYASTDLEVYLVTNATGAETLLVEGTGASNYSVSVAEYPGTGSVIYPADESTEIISDYSVLIKRVLPIDQQVGFNNQGGYDPKVLQKVVDKLAIIALQQQEELDRSFKISLSDTTLTDLDIPNVVGASAGDVIGLASDKASLIWYTPNSSTYISFPASITDNALLRADGTGGSTYQTTGVIVSDNDDITGPRDITASRLVTASGGFAGNKGADIASAGTLVVGTDGDFFDITGTTTITGMTVGAGRHFFLQFDAALTLTHGASLLLPGSANITTAAGDVGLFYATAADTVTCLAYAKDAETLYASVGAQLSAGFSGTSYSVGNTGSGTVTLDVANGNIQHATVTGSFTLGAVTLTGVGDIDLELVNDGTGGYSPDFTTNFEFIDGTYDDAASAYNLVRISKRNGKTYLEIVQDE